MMMTMNSPSLAFFLLALLSSTRLVHGGAGMGGGGGGQYVNTERPPRQCTCSVELSCEDTFSCWCEINESTGCRCRFSAANTPYFSCQDSSECCDWEDPEERHRNRRVLRQDDPQSDSEIAALTETCGLAEYNVALQVEDSHLRAVATPAEETSDCPLLVVHSVFDKTLAAAASPVQKELIAVWNHHEHQHGEEEATTKEQLLYMGTFPLARLLQAYQTTLPSSRHGRHDQSYNVWTNNCSAFLLNLASALDIQIDTRVTQFVVQRLLLQPLVGTFLDSLRESLFHPSVPGRQLRHNSHHAWLSDHDLVQLLVQQNVGL